MLNTSFNTDPDALQPMTVVQVIDRTFRIYRDHFIAFIGMVAIVTIPLTLFNYVLTSNTVTTVSQRDPESFQFEIPSGFWLSIVMSIIILIIQSIVINGLITYISSEYHLGRKISIGEAFSMAGNRLWTLALALIFVGIIFFGSMFLLGVLSAICGVFLIIFPIVFYLTMTIYFYVVPVIILENVNFRLGVSRAMFLGKERFWPTIGLFLLIYIMSFLISIIVGLVLGIFSGGVDQATINQGPDLVNTLAEMSVNIFITPIIPIALTIMYYDTRIRTEGLDIALSTVDKADPRPSDIESPRPSVPLLRGRDIGNIVLLIAGFIALVFVLGLLGAGLFSLVV